MKPNKARTGGAPLFTVRFARLADGAGVIGLSWEHSIGDMHSFMLFMRVWSAAVEGTPMPEPLLVEDREAYLSEHIPDEGADRPGLHLASHGEILRLAARLTWDAFERTRVQVQFSEAEIQRMRESFGAASGVRLSANDAVCAHLMDVISACEDRRRERRFALVVDFRRRAGLDPMLMGNCVAFVCLDHPSGEHPAHLGRRIREAVTSFSKEHMDYHATRRFFASLGGSGRLARCIPNCIDATNPVLVMSNWSKLGVYDVSFGGQTPAFFTAGNSPHSWRIRLVEGRDNSGLLCIGAFPSALAARLSSEEGRSRLPRFARS